MFRTSYNTICCNICRGHWGISLPEIGPAAIDFDELMKLNLKKLFLIIVSFISGGEVKKVHLKRPWSEKENKIFHTQLAKYLSEKINPPKSALEKVCQLLNKTRTVLQIRARANNIIKGKQFYM